MIAEDSNPFAMPLVVAVTGHRDLVASEVPEIRLRVRTLLEKLAMQFPSRRLTVMSALAEGADQLVAEVALDLGADLTVTLPMPRELYLQDFETVEARNRFNTLCDRANTCSNYRWRMAILSQTFHNPGGREVVSMRRLVFFYARTVISCSRSGTARSALNSEVPGRLLSFIMTMSCPVT
ncbi:MAG: hypothetical protein U5K38_08270 [Woeseiaceae bacterium]|nr:hypothetical protein [Woeseiaceae bacterium]